MKSNLDTVLTYLDCRVARVDGEKSPYVVKVIVLGFGNVIRCVRRCCFLLACR